MDTSWFKRPFASVPYDRRSGISTRNESIGRIDKDGARYDERMFIYLVSQLSRKIKKAPPLRLSFVRLLPFRKILQRSATRGLIIRRTKD